MSNTIDTETMKQNEQVAANGQPIKWPPPPSAPPPPPPPPVDDDAELGTSQATVPIGQHVSASEAKKYALSPLRWPLLLAVMIFGFCNGFANEHSVILNVYVESLDIELADYINLYQAFFFVPMVASFLAANLVDNCGLKMTIYTTLLMAFVRNGARMLLFMPDLVGWRQLRLVYWLIMRGLTQMNFAFYICFPLKLSESWFPDTERSLAWSLSNGAPVLGVASASLVLPHVVKNLSSCHWVVWFNGASLFVSMLAIGFGVRRSEPAEGAPSLRNELSQQHKLAESGGGGCNKEVELAYELGNSTAPTALQVFGRQIVRVMKNSNLMIQLLVINTFEQLLLCIFMVLQDIFKGAGLSGVFTGQFLAGQIFAAIAIQTLVASRLKPKGNETDPYNTRTCKLLVTAVLITFVLFAMSLVLHELPMFEANANWFEQYQWLLVSVCALVFVVAHNCAKPFLTDQTGELICGVVSEANSSAFLSAMSAVVFNVSAFIFVRLRQIDETNSATETPVDSSESATTISADLAFDVDNLDAELVDLVQNSTIAPSASEPTGQPLYLWPILFICCVAITNTLIYLLKFDSSSSKKRKRLRQLQRERQQSISAWREPNEQVVEIELTKL